jgi:ATP-binding cassette subfamily F protein 3
MLQARHVSKSYGGKQVLDGVSFVVNAGERLALLGPNGAGKSTLLRTLADVEKPDAGRVVLSPPSLQLGYLPQGYADQPDVTIDSAIPEMARRRAVEQEVTQLADELAREEQPPTSLADAYESALEELAALAKALEGGIEPLLQEWGLGSLDYGRPVASLSGGERTRLGLARVLAQRPDVLLLDEPTNHLDLEGIEALETWLVGYRGALVLVTHDRALLATIPTSVLELAPDGGRWRYFSGPYIAFLEAKERELQQQRGAYGRQERQVRRVKEQIRRLKQRAAGIERETTHFYYRKRAARVARQAKVTERRLERFLASEQRVQRPERQPSLRPELATAGRSGDRVLSLEAVSLQVGGRVILRDLNFELYYEDRAALLGPNGSGKTTLLRAIAGRLEPATGLVRLGAAVRAGLLEQGQEDLDTSLNAVETLRPLVMWDEGTLRRFLNHYLFTAADVHIPAARLSYGQRARLALAKLALEGVNLLLLDEPTNHLDIPSREAFEEVLRTFEGTVLIVTHDRYFVESFASDVLRIEGGTVREYPLYL